jgi:alkylated DNA repair protein alkB homolog 1
MSASLDVNSPAYKKALRLHKKSKRTPAAESLPVLREQEKAFKARFPPPSLSEVLDLSWNENVHGNAWKGGATIPDLHKVQCLDGKTAYTIGSLPGE